ncbi:hypothetical protein [Shewanella indica]
MPARIQEYISIFAILLIAKFPTTVDTQAIKHGDTEMGTQKMALQQSGRLGKQGRMIKPLLTDVSRDPERDF